MARYERAMSHSAAAPNEESAEAALRAELAQGDTVLQSVGPVMRYLLIGAPNPVFADEIVARVRGGTTDVARQLVGAVHADNPEVHDERALDGLIAALGDIPGFLAHVHAHALEWQLAEQLQARLALDPTLPPLLEALLASDDPATSALSMNLLAAQARFAQTQRRMQLPLNELPADLLHGALLAMRTFVGNEPDGVAAEARIRAGYDESRTRLGLIARLVTAMGSGVVAALSLTHAGVAIFGTALSMASGQDRDVVIFSTSEGQSVRLALALKAAGLNQGAIEEQLLTLHSDIGPPLEWGRMSADRAAEILAVAIPSAGT